MELRVTAHFATGEIFQLLIYSCLSRASASTCPGLSGRYSLASRVLAVNFVEKERRRHRFWVGSAHLRFASGYRTCRHLFDHPHVHVGSSSALTFSPRTDLTSGAGSGEIPRSDMFRRGFDIRSLWFQIEGMCGQFFNVKRRILGVMLRKYVSFDWTWHEQLAIFFVF